MKTKMQLNKHFSVQTKLTGTPLSVAVRLALGETQLVEVAETKQLLVDSVMHSM